LEERGSTSILVAFYLSPKPAVAVHLLVLRPPEEKTAQALSRFHASPVQAREEGSCVRRCDYTIIAMVSIIFTKSEELFCLSDFCLPIQLVYSSGSGCCVPSFRECDCRC